MTILYQWHTRGEKPCFACSRWNGQIFHTVDSLPELPVHPNCECVVRAFDKDTEALKTIVARLIYLRSQVQEMAIALEPLLIIKFLQILFFRINILIDGSRQILQTIDIFIQNYNDMVKANRIGADKYFHSKANAQAAQLGNIGEITAMLIGDAREITDVVQLLFEQNMTVSTLVKDIQEDMKANAFGRGVGRQHPSDEMKDFLEQYRPEGLENEY